MLISRQKIKFELCLGWEVNNKNNCLHIAFDSAKEIPWCIEFTAMAQFTAARHREVFRIVINKRDGDCQ